MKISNIVKPAQLVLVPRKRVVYMGVSVRVNDEDDDIYCLFNSMGNPALFTKESIGEYPIYSFDFFAEKYLQNDLSILYNLYTILTSKNNYDIYKQLCKTQILEAL